MTRVIPSELRDMPESVAIALTGFGMEADVQSTREAGFAVHLTKPVDIASLNSAIQKLVSTPPQPKAEVQPV